MTVAAIVLAGSVESALAEAAGRPAVRRISEVAWAGGAVPIVVVSYERDGRVGAALAGSQAVLAEPGPPEGGPVGQMVRGVRVASGTIADTEGCLLWPASMPWVDSETVTSLIEAYGRRPDRLLRPAWQGQAGWPVLLPLSRMDALEALGTARMPDELLADLEAAGVPVEALELGDPGTTHEIDVDLEDLPVYQGPAAPLGGPQPEWGAPAADRSDDDPLQGPWLAPYSQASDPDG